MLYFTGTAVRKENIFIVLLKKYYVSKYSLIYRKIKTKIKVSLGDFLFYPALSKTSDLLRLSQRFI